MKKILVIDYLTYEGHRNFNKIHVECLEELGCSLHVVGRKSALDIIKKSNSISFTFFPKWMSKPYPVKAISERIKNIISLIWIKNHFNFEEFDFVIFLIYDVLTLSFLKISGPVLIINHNNVSQLSNKIKLMLTRCLPPNYAHIALSEEMEERLKALLPNTKVYNIPHGLCPPSHSLVKPNFINDGESFLFCPINRNFDLLFVKTLFENQQLLSYLKCLKVKLYIKDSLGVRNNSNEVVILPSNLNVAEYNYMIQNAMAVLLPYGRQFKYRCSGIFFECVARQTPVICTNLDAMKIFERDVDMRMFSDTKELIDAIGYYAEHKVRVTDISVFNPKEYWNGVLDGLEES